jgi:hypothetical protein
MPAKQPYYRARDANWTIYVDTDDLAVAQKVVQQLTGSAERLKIDQVMQDPNSTKNPKEYEGTKYYVVFAG